MCCMLVLVDTLFSLLQPQHPLKSGVSTAAQSLFSNGLKSLFHVAGKWKKVFPFRGDSGEKCLLSRPTLIHYWTNISLHECISTIYEAILKMVSNKKLNFILFKKNYY